MLTKLTIRNFKRFEEVDIPLGDGFVFIGPNNSGKTSALQALALWYTGLQKWQEKHGEKEKQAKAIKYTGVTVNRLSLVNIPIQEMDMMWRNRKVRWGNPMKIYASIFLSME